MTLNGANGTTLKNMAQALGVPSTNLGGLNQRNRELMQQLNSRSEVQLEVANAILVDRSNPLKEPFKDVCKNNYNAEVRSASFSRETANEINAWCSAKTHGKIPTILNGLSSNEKVVLLNAIYFKGNWANKFNESATKDDLFKLESGSTQSIKMMHQYLERYHYFKAPGYSSVILPYNGGDQSMYIFLPDEGVKLSSLKASFTETNWNTWMQMYKVVNVDMSMPKFKINSELPMNSSLAAIGMRDALSRGADFSNMASGNLYISKVVQKTFMDVNESGTEAAAATGLTMARPTVAMRDRLELVHFRVDRPFILALVNNKSNDILFMAAVSDIKQN